MLVRGTAGAAAEDRAGRARAPLVRYSRQPGRRPLYDPLDLAGGVRHIYQQRCALLDQGPRHTRRAVQTTAALAAEHLARSLLHSQDAAAARSYAASERAVAYGAHSAGSDRRTLDGGDHARG